jgi:hypothetical protein
MTILFMTIFFVVAQLIPFINEPKKEADVAPEPQGNLLVELFWPDEAASDIDLWVYDSADNTTVGYSNKGGEVFNLLRDDLGLHNDHSNKNREIALSRGLPDGEYIINAHWFGDRDHGKYPEGMPVQVTISQTTHSGPVQQVVTSRIKLPEQGSEITLVRFMVVNGKVNKKTINTVQKAIMPFKSKMGEE